jgi:hypothetical protein
VFLIFSLINKLSPVENQKILGGIFCCLFILISCVFFLVIEANFKIFTELILNKASDKVIKCADK